MKLARLIVSTLLLGAAAFAHALDVKPYSPEVFAQAQKAGQPVALHFHADWCPTCRSQDKVLESLKAEPGLDLTVLTVNYDTEKELKKQFNVRTQSTLVVLKGGQESGRSIGDTTAAGLRATLKTAL